MIVCVARIYTSEADIGVIKKEQNYIHGGFVGFFILELNPRGQVAPQVYVDNCDATN